MGDARKQYHDAMLVEHSFEQNDALYYYNDMYSYILIVRTIHNYTIHLFYFLLLFLIPYAHRRHSAVSQISNTISLAKTAVPY